VDDADLATHRFRPEWLVDWIVRELPITSPPRRRAIVPECAWHLGDAKCGDTWVTAIFARRISNLAALERLASELRTIHPAEKGIVLTTSMHAARHVQLPGKYELLPLMEIIRAAPDGLMLDIQRLGFWLGGMEPSTAKRGATRSGRPSIQADIVAQIYDKRRSQGLPVRSDRGEAQEILKEWREQTSDRRPPHVSTLRRYVARLGGGRSSE
jgi:hypothetical protein